MADIRDYLEMRGDIRLSERSFNDCDALALACLSYLDLGGIVGGPGEPSVSVSDVCEAFLGRVGEEGDVSAWVRSLAQVDGRFVSALGEGERLGSARLRDYVDVVDAGRVLQFSAVTVELDDGCDFVAFRGTDSTLVGWREDFMLSFQVTEAQRAAAAYLEREASLAGSRGRDVCVGGHSKGGVLAAYAAATLSEALRGRVRRVWSFDGPCMTAEAVPARCVDVYRGRYLRVVPEYSIVGMLFDDGSPKTVVRSAAAGASQHDPMTWQVKAQGLDEAPGLLPEAQRMDEALAAWIAGIDVDERERFTNELFDVLGAGDATTLDEVLGSARSIQRVLQALAEADQRTRDLVWELLGAALGANFDAAWDAASRRAAQLLQK